MRFVGRGELTAEQAALLEEAREASVTATANYSHYRVGAALQVRRADGTRVVVRGNNFETLTFNSVCAEKHALMKAFAEHSVVVDGEVVRPVIEAVAVHCATGGSPQQPCGDCRQTLFEVNPDMPVIAGAGETGGDEPYDSRVSITVLRELLPFSFELKRAGVSRGQDAPVRMDEPSGVGDFVVHFPRPGDLGGDVEARVALLREVQFLLLVGSPSRARAVAEQARETLGVEGGCYCDLTVAGRDETTREMAAWTLPLWEGGPRVAVLSHGIGESGVEIVLSEFPALLHLVNGVAPTIRGVIRAGTRGTLSQVPLGCIALSTSVFNDVLDRLTPSASVVDAVRQGARALGMTVCEEEVIEDAQGRDASLSPQQLLMEGPSLASRFFWRGQGRPVYRPAPDLTLADAEQRQRLDLLQRLVRRGVRWIEMEDYTVLDMAQTCGYPAATLGAVIAHRRGLDGAFQVDYSKAMYKASEMIPTRVALEAFAVIARGAASP